MPAYVRVNDDFYQTPAYPVGEKYRFNCPELRQIHGHSFLIEKNEPQIVVKFLTGPMVGKSMTVNPEEILNI